MSELAPCPFCAAEDIRIFNDPDEYRRDSWGCQCCSCWCQGSQHGSEAEAISAWNRRASTASPLGGPPGELEEPIPSSPPCGMGPSDLDAGLGAEPSAAGRTTYERILDVMTRAEGHPLGVAGLMIMDEIAAGRTAVQPGSKCPFAFSADDWTYPAVVSHDGREVRIVAIRATEPGNGAFRRLIDNIAAAGLSPVVCEPVGVVMPAIMKRWGWRGRTIGSGEDRVSEWRPPVARERKRHSSPRQVSQPIREAK